MIVPEAPEIPLEKFIEHEDEIETRDVTPHDFGRIAAQTAKQVILQRIREAERDMMFEEYRDRVGELITGLVQQSDSRYTLVQLRERVEALLPKSEQVDGERYDHGQRIKAVIKEVSSSTRGPSIIVSRRDPELIKKLFELEVPEIADGLVEITNVAREPGYRSKIAVVSHADGVDPVGACVGPRGSRVRMVVSELRGEKIDIIPYNDEPARFVAKALSPARVREVLVDDSNKQATVIVPDDQLSLAIGREGQNARLAARLTGWRVDIRSETEFAREDTDSGYGRGRGRRRPLPRDPRQRAPLPERRAARLALLRPARAPGARGREHRRGRRGAEGPRRSSRAHVPERRCVGLRRPRASRAALRTLRYRGWCAGPRSAGTAAGRGAWVHPNQDCFRASASPAGASSAPSNPREHPTGHRRLHSHMAKKRVNELAKQYDMPSAEVLKRLAAHGIEVKAAASAVDEDAADRALTGKPPKPQANGGQQQQQRPRPVRPGMPLDQPLRPPAPEAAARGRRRRARARARAEQPARRPGQARRTASSAASAPTRDSLQGERAPGAAGGVRRVVIDSQASRRQGPGPAVPAAPAARPSAGPRGAAAAAVAAPTRSPRRRTRRSSSPTPSGSTPARRSRTSPSTSACPCPR